MGHEVGPVERRAKGIGDRLVGHAACLDVVLPGKVRRLAAVVLVEERGRRLDVLGRVGDRVSMRCRN